MKTLAKHALASSHPDRAFDVRQLRRTILDLAFRGQTAHLGCALSLVEILAVLYRNHLRLGLTGPLDSERDYLLLSKGHGVMAQYACLHELGWLEEQDLAGYFADGSRLHGLAHSHLPGIEVTSGSLGHGLSIGVGLAMGCQRQQSDQRIFVILGDGELNAGPIWEAALFAAQQHLTNLIAVVDANGFQALGRIQDVMNLGSIAGKFNAFGWEVAEANGHDERDLDAALERLVHSESAAPRALVARTVKGAGVSFMENDNSWHYRRLCEADHRAAMIELGF